MFSWCEFLRRDNSTQMLSVEMGGDPEGGSRLRLSGEKMLEVLVQQGLSLRGSPSEAHAFLIGSGMWLWVGCRSQTPPHVTHELMTHSC